jgi:aconitate hydratase
VADDRIRHAAFAPRLVAMCCILPLQFRDGENAAMLGLTGHETYTINGLAAAGDGPYPSSLTVHADNRAFP